MKLQDLVADILESLGAAGLAGREDKTTKATGFWNMRKCKHDCIFHNPRDIAKLETRIAVWASADGTLFPSADERDAYEDKTNTPGLTNAEHFHHNAIGNPVHGGNRSYNAWMKACPYQNASGYCSCCRISDRKNCCRPAWDKSPYGMPLDKRIPWPKP